MNLLNFVAIAEVYGVHVAFGGHEEHRTRAASRRVRRAERDAGDGTRAVEYTCRLTMSAVNGQTSQIAFLFHIVVIAR